MSAPPGRVLGVDAGEKRVGLAMSDETGLLASPFQVLTRSGPLSETLHAIGRVIAEHAVQSVVVGLPLNVDGSEGKQAKRARHFAERLERVAQLPVLLWDERLSTREAEALVRGRGRSLRARRGRGEIDALAAAVFLQDFLDAEQRERARAERLKSREGNSWPG